MDGDAKNMKTINDSPPYEVQVQKDECVIHVQKQFGRALINLKDENNLKGAGGLTMNLIKRCQNYYGYAIRKNVGNSSKIKDAILAIYYHQLDDHKFCPTDENSWCKSIKGQSSKQSSKKKPLNIEIWQQTKRVFDKFSSDQLIERCVNGFSQNICESFNSLIWTRVPKSTYRSIDSIKLGVLDAVICTNEGYTEREEVLKQLGIGYSNNTVESLRNLDDLQLQNHNRSLRKNPKHLPYKTNLHECYDAGNFMID